LGRVTVHQDNERLSTMEISLKMPSNNADKTVDMRYPFRRPETRWLSERFDILLAYFGAGYWGRVFKWYIKNIIYKRHIKTMLDNRGELTIRHFRNMYLLAATPVEKGIESVDIKKDGNFSIFRALTCGTYSAKIKGKPFSEIELTYR
jgi:hypothetical protein